MTATTIEKLTEYRGAVSVRRNPPMLAASKVLKGTIVAIDSSGYALAAALLAGGTARVLGVALATCDNTSGASGDLRAEVGVGIYGPFKNSTSGDLIDEGDIGATCYVVDNQTVALTSATSTRAVAGTVEEVTSAGVYVRFA